MTKPKSGMRYMAHDVNSVSVDSLLERCPSARCVVAIDVAKEKMVAAVMTEQLQETWSSSTGATAPS